MSMNRVQFQPGLSMPDFIRQYGTEAQCEEALIQTRWSEGFDALGVVMGAIVYFILKVAKHSNAMPVTVKRP